jgi:hypothetical protein
MSRIARVRVCCAAAVASAVAGLILMRLTVRSLADPE